jgi:hypothetical protein
MQSMIILTMILRMTRHRAPLTRTRLHHHTTSPHTPHHEQLKTTTEIHAAIVNCKSP